MMTSHTQTELFCIYLPEKKTPTPLKQDWTSCSINLFLMGLFCGMILMMFVSVTESQVREIIINFLKNPPRSTRILKATPFSNALIMVIDYRLSASHCREVQYPRVSMLSSPDFRRETLDSINHKHYRPVSNLPLPELFGLRVLASCLCHGIRWQKFHRGSPFFSCPAAWNSLPLSL